jgi:hypothetical protein
MSQVVQSGATGGGADFWLPLLFATLLGRMLVKTAPNCCAG